MGLWLVLPCLAGNENNIRFFSPYFYPIGLLGDCLLPNGQKTGKIAAIFFEG